MKKIAVLFLIIIILFQIVACKEPEIPSDISESDVLEDTYYKLTGYPKTKFDDNVENWLLTALEDNPGIISAYENKDMLFKAMWFGEFSGKLLMSISYAYNTSRDEKLLNAGNELVAKLALYQRQDGYLGPFAEGYELIGNEFKTAWDLWGNYHNIMALYKWYELTNNIVAKDTAIKALDFILEFMSQNDRNYIDADWAEMNLSITHAFAYFYNKTKDARYLTEALRILNFDWEQSDTGNGGLWSSKPGDWYHQALSGKDFYLGSKPRWEALYAIMSLGELYKATEEESYYTAFENIWWSIIKTDRHNNGSFSSGEAAANGAYNNDAAIETCCSIAWMEFSVEYLNLSKNSYVADELELSNFNAIYATQMELADEQKQYYTYNTPMDGAKVSAYKTIGGLGGQGETTAPDVSCCQLSGPKGPSLISQWGTFTDESGVYLNYYGESEIKENTPLGNSVIIKQQTSYPANGKITISLDVKSEKFNLNLRIPSWSKNTTVKLNGATISNVKSGEYLQINNVWKSTDIIEIELDMSIHYLKGQNNYEGYASIYYGPILLALDTNDEATAKLGSLSKTNFDNIAAQKGTDSWISIDIPTSKGNITFQNFSSCGKGTTNLVYGNNYQSWFKLTNLNGLLFSRDSLPLWCER